MKVNKWRELCTLEFPTVLDDPPKTTYKNVIKLLSHTSSIMIHGIMYDTMSKNVAHIAGAKNLQYFSLWILKHSEGTLALSVLNIVYSI